MTTPSNALNITTSGAVFFSTASQFSAILPGATGTVFTSRGPISIPAWLPAAASGFTSVNIQTFTTPGTNTYTPTAGTIWIIVEICGGGGAGGGTNSGAGGGGGGGAGGYCRGTFTVPLTPQSFTLGSGGVGSGATSGTSGTVTTYGAMSAYGGAGGQFVTSGSNVIPLGGVGGLASGGSVNSKGQSGGFCSIYSTTTSGGIVSGVGGSSFFGGAGWPVTGNSAGNTGSMGSGGSGGTGVTSGGGTPGGTGGAGICVITEFIS